MATENTRTTTGKTERAPQSADLQDQTNQEKEMYGHPKLINDQLPPTHDVVEMTREQALAEWGEMISSYTRAQAIDDGILVDVTETAQEAGFKWAVAITRAAWAACVEWSKQDSKRQAYQDEMGRLWDVIYMASLAARRGGDQTLFNLYRIPRGGRGVRPRLTTLKLQCGPGDYGNPVITIMLPDED